MKIKSIGGILGDAMIVNMYDLTFNLVCYVCVSENTHILLCISKFQIKIFVYFMHNVSKKFQGNGRVSGLAVEAFCLLYIVIN